MAVLRFILTPIDRIFFGGEKSPFNEEYFLKSRMMPQQTAVLGFLRYEALRRSGYLGNKSAGWDDLIGESSFNGMHGQGFGIIERISPVSIYQKSDGADLYHMRYPKGMKPRSVNGIRVNFGEDEKVWSGLEVFEGHQKGSHRFDPKRHDHFEPALTDFKGKLLKLIADKDESIFETHKLKIPSSSPVKGVFWEDIRTGITKNYLGVSKEDGFYKIAYWRLLSGYAYSFLAEINDHESIAQWENKSIVQFGGDGSLYQLEIVPDVWPQDASTNRIFVLLSDCQVDNAVYDLCAASISQTIGFRNLKTANADRHQSTTRFTKRPVLKWYRSSAGTGRNTDPARVLLEKGSILIAKDGCEQQLYNILSNNPPLRKIGYNYFQSMDSLPQEIL